MNIFDNGIKCSVYFVYDWPKIIYSIRYFFYIFLLIYAPPHIIGLFTQTQYKSAVENTFVCLYVTLG